jgi:hypothetical protein
MAYRVDAAVDAMEAASGNALPHTTRGEAERIELGKAKHSVLARREAHYRRLARGFRKKRDI